MKNVLLVYELIPEDTRMFVIPEDEYNKHNLDDINGKICNAHEWEEKMVVACHLIGKKEHFLNDVRPYTGNFLKYEVEIVQGKPLEEDISKVVFTGILL